ncbi:MAG: DNA-binding response regulator [Chloroflexi bacterium]|nr:MAG: DNA-binding response regulator [Chloroflexota bacterium]
MKPIRVLLADDHVLVRAGFRSLIERTEDMEVVAEADNGREALQLIAKHKPDVVLIDIAMPGLNGLEACVRIARDFPKVRTLILSMHMSEEYVLQALQAGASGYMVKGADPAEFELAIRAVARGETYLSPMVSRHVIEEYLRRTHQQEPEEEPAATAFQQLTPRQREVLQLIAEGHTSPEIAKILHISPKTVEAHRQQIMERLDIHDIAGLVRYAIKSGLISLE